MPISLSYINIKMSRKGVYDIFVSKKSYENTVYLYSQCKEISMPLSGGFLNALYEKLLKRNSAGGFKFS